MQHYIGTRDTLEHILILGEVAPDDTQHRMLLLQRFEQLFVFLTRTGEDSQLVILVRETEYLHHTRLSHGACCTG